MSGARSALVVANDRYDDAGLRELVAPAQDADALAAALGDPAVGGFDVRVLRNAAAQELRVAVEDFFADRRSDDLLLLHFSCHGVKNAAGELFLAMADTKPDRLASTAVSADFVNRQMADSRAQRIALFLDCCYGGAFPRGMVVRAAGEAQVRDAFAGQERVGGGRGRVVVTASRAMEYAFEGDQLTGGPARPSVFTGAVVDGLTTGEADRDGDGWIGLTELVGYVSDRVQRVTPHQNPQMWTFGSQGELLIARSRARRVSPGALPPELLEALESPLAAVRFGVADELTSRIADTDLTQAYAAFLALRRLVDDDSRKVSDAARRGVEGATPHVPPSLELDADGTGEVTLTGPPIARAVVASPREPWLAVRQEGAVVRVRATPPGPGPHEGTLTLAGPTGEATVTVHAAGQEADPDPDPEPDPPPVAASVGQTVVTSPSEPPSAPHSRGAGAGAVPWWAIGVLAALGVALVVVNWPGSDGTHLWYDEDHSWYVYRSRHDSAFVGSLLTLAAAAGARFLRPLLGVAVGGAAYLVTAGVLYLGADLADDQTDLWIGTVLLAAAVVATAWYARRPSLSGHGTPDPAGAVLVLGGAGLIFASSLIPHSDISWSEVTNGVGVLDPLVLAALSWPTLRRVADAATRELVVVAAATTVLLDAYSDIPALTSDQNLGFGVSMAGHAAILAGIGLAAFRHRRQSVPQP
jgi:uncharacterized caspase-like protein